MVAGGRRTVAKGRGTSVGAVQQGCDRARHNLDKWTFAEAKEGEGREQGSGKCREPLLLPLLLFSAAMLRHLAYRPSCEYEIMT